MACKQGIRKNLEESKRYYEQLKQYDPYQELWSSLVNRVAKTESGYEGLTADERVYYSVGMFDGEIYNGGVHQFFSNTSGRHYEDVVNSLLELRALNCLRLLTRAAVLLFDGKKPSVDRVIRNQELKDYPENPGDPSLAWVQELEAIDQEYWSDPDGLSGKLGEFARDRGLLAQFEIETTAEDGPELGPEKAHL